MAKVSLFNTEGSQVGEIELNDAVFGVEVNEHIMHKAVVAHLAAMRQGTQSAKTRSDVSGGGRKPWRQKGTGHARQGSIRAPQWKGGGIVFAPKPRDYDVKINKKEKQLALKSALTSKVNEGKLIVLDSLELDEIKTKKFAEIMKNLNVCKAFVVLGEKNENVEKSAANIQGIETSTTNTISTYDVLRYDTLVLTQDAVNRITEVYA